MLASSGSNRSWNGDVSLRFAESTHVSGSSNRLQPSQRVTRRHLTSVKRASIEKCDQGLDGARVTPQALGARVGEASSASGVGRSKASNGHTCSNYYLCDGV